MIKKHFMITWGSAEWKGTRALSERCFSNIDSAIVFITKKLNLNEEQQNSLHRNHSALYDNDNKLVDITHCSKKHKVVRD